MNIFMMKLHVQNLHRVGLVDNNVLNLFSPHGVNKKGNNPKISVFMISMRKSFPLKNRRDRFFLSFCFYP